MPLAVVPVLALTSFLSSTFPPPTHRPLLPSFSSDQRTFPPLLPTSSISPEAPRKRGIPESTTRPPEARVSTPRTKGAENAVTTDKVEPKAADASTGELPLAQRGASILNTSGDPFRLSGSKKDRQPDLDQEIDEPVLGPESVEDEEWDRSRPVPSLSWPNLQPLSISEFLHRFSSPTNRSSPANNQEKAGVLSLQQPIREWPSTREPPPQTRNGSDRGDYQADHQADMMRTMMRSLFSGASAPVLEHLVNAVAPIRTSTTKKPVSRPTAVSPLMHRWIDAAQKLTQNQTSLSGREHSSPEEILAADSDAAKKYFLNRVIPVMEVLYTNARNSSMRIPPRNMHAFDAFALDKDDMTNSFGYKFLKNLLTSGLGGRKPQLNGLEDFAIMIHKVVSQANVLSLLRHVTASNHFNNNDTRDAAHNDPVILHEDFESNFDDMSEEKWYQTPEFVVTISVLSALVLFVLVFALVTWCTSRKSSSFPVSGDPMNYERASKSQILYI